MLEREQAALTVFQCFTNVLYELAANCWMLSVLFLSE